MSPLLLLLLSLYSFLTLSITITHAYHPNTISTPTFPIPRILDIHHINLTTTSSHTYMSTVKPIMSEGCRISLITWKQGNYENQKLMSAFTGQSFDDLGIFDGCQLLDIAHHCTADFTIQNYTDPQANIISVTMGLCIPKNCTQEDLLLDLPTFMGLPLGLEYYGLVAEGFIKPNITYTACADQQTRWYQNRDAVAMVVVVCVLAVITLVATIADHMLSMRDFALEQDRARDSQDYPSVAAYVSLPNFAQDLHQRHNGTNGSGHTSHDETISINRTHEPIPTWRQFIHCFSAIRNIRKLIAPIPASASGIDMSCLNGIRVLSMIWVIVGHTVVFQLSLFRDPVYLFGEVVKRISFQVVLEAFYAVDSFFFLSGFLSAYFLFQQIQRGGRLTKLLSGYYLHRYLRLTPIYAFWLFMNWKLALFIGAGESPLQHLRQGAVTLTSDGYQYFGPDQACDKYWWTNLLYINNFHPKSLDDECMAWGWYLANDMQFAIILPILILIYHRHRIAGLALLIAMLTASCTYVGIVSHQNNFTTVFYDPNNGDHWNEKVYVKPWARIQPYLIGILYAYLLHARPQRIPTRIYWPCMAMAAFLMTSLVFGPAQLYRSDDGINAWSRTTHDLYLATGRGIWAIGLGYLCYSMIVGTGEEPLLDVSAPTKKTHQPGSYLTSILGHSIWTPLARLSYEAYLVHEIWVSIFMYNYRSKPYYSDLMYIYWIVGNVMMAFVLAFVGYVLVEKPIMNLTNWCMSTLRGKSSTKSQDD